MTARAKVYGKRGWAFRWPFGRESEPPEFVFGKHNRIWLTGLAGLHSANSLTIDHENWAVWMSPSISVIWFYVVDPNDDVD